MSIPLSALFGDAGYCYSRVPWFTANWPVERNRAPVAQRIEHWPPEPGAWVRVPPGVPDHFVDRTGLGRVIYPVSTALNSAVFEHWDSIANGSLAAARVHRGLSQRGTPCHADNGRRDQGRSEAGIQPRSSRQSGPTSASRLSPRPLMSTPDSPYSTRSLTTLPVAGVSPNPWADAVTTT